MAEERYTIPKNPRYSGEIRKLQDTDPASASAIFNPLFQRLIENAHFLYCRQRAERRRVLAVREREAGRPDYGLESSFGPGGEVVLNTGAYTGTAEISVVAGGVEYDAKNLSANGENAPDETLIMTKLEE